LLVTGLSASEASEEKENKKILRK